MARKDEKLPPPPHPPLQVRASQDRESKLEKASLAGQRPYKAAPSPFSPHPSLRPGAIAWRTPLNFPPESPGAIAATAFLRGKCVSYLYCEARNYASDSLIDPPSPHHLPLRPGAIAFLQGECGTDDASCIVRLVSLPPSPFGPGGGRMGGHRGGPALHSAGVVLDRQSVAGAPAGPSDGAPWAGAAGAGADGAARGALEGPLPPPADVYCSPSLFSPFYYLVDPLTMEMSKQRFDDSIKFDWGAPVAEPDPAAPGAFLCAGARWGGGYVLYSLRLGPNGEEAHLLNCMHGTLQHMLFFAKTEMWDPALAFLHLSPPLKCSFVLSLRLAAAAGAGGGARDAGRPPLLPRGHQGVHEVRHAARGAARVQPPQAHLLEQDAG